MRGLRRSLSAFEAFTLSLAIIAPTLAMAFNVSLAAQAAGRATPLAFLIGGATMALIGLSFVAFARRVTSAGSAYAYVDAVFGRRWGFLAGWALLFAYLAFLFSATGLVGSFVATGLKAFGIELPGLWVVIAAAGALLVIRLGGREIKQATWIMLAIEAVAVLAIVALAIVILTKVPLTAEPFVPDPARGWAGVVYGMVFAVLSVAGFEGAATVAEETRDPHRAIPIAIVGSVLAATLLYGLVSYAQVLGYGLSDTQALAEAHAPLDALSARYVSNGYGVFLDFAAGVSSFACALGTASAAARILYVLGQAGLGGRLGLAQVDPEHGAPVRAVRFVGACNIAALLAFATWAGPRSYSEGFSTLATLALILVYIAVALAQAFDARRGGRNGWFAIGIAGALLLCWPLANTLYPVPAWPGNLWPFVVAAWVMAGVLLSLVQPALVRRT